MLSRKLFFLFDEILTKKKFYKPSLRKDEIRFFGSLNKKVSNPSHKQRIIFVQFSRNDIKTQLKFQREQQPSKRLGR